MTRAPRFTVVAVIDIPPEAVGVLQRYEAGVLSPLTGVQLEQRVVEFLDDVAEQTWRPTG